MAIGNRVFERKINLERLGIVTTNPLDHSQFLAVWMTDSIQPRRILEPNRIDNERVALPLAHGLAIPGDIGILRVRLIQRNLPPSLVPFPELIDVVVGLDNLELQWMLVLPGKPERVGILQCRVCCVFEIRLRTATGPLALHAFERPLSIRNVRLGARLLSRRAPRRLSAAQPHTGNVWMLRR